MIELPQIALQRRIVILVAALLLVGLGVVALTQLKIEAYPDISDTQVVVVSTFPGYAAEEVEKQVSIPIERALNSVPNVISRRSRTIFGLSVVELTFADGVDDYFARQLVLEKLRDADLPPGVQPSLGPLSTSIGEMIRYRVEGKPEVSEMRLREVQDWFVVPRLLQVPGVADVTVFGGPVRQYQVEIDPLALEKYGLSINQIADAINANNQNAGGGVIDNRQQSLVVRGVGLVNTIPDIENIVVGESKGTPVFVRDVAKVKIGAAPQTGVFGCNDKQGGTEGIVLMRRWENPTELLDRLHDKVTELNTLLEPEGIKIVTIYDRSELVENTLHTVVHTLVEGLLIVVFVLMFFLGSVRAAILTAVTIPLSLLFAFLCMKASGVPANLLSLGALDFGIIVDGSLVMVEHILHALGHLEHKGKPKPASVFQAIRRSALEIERPIFFSMAIIISAYIPLFTMQRVERRLFAPMAFTVCSALLGSLLLSLTVVPVLATYLFKNGAKEWENPLVRWLRKGYGGILDVTISRSKTVVAASAFIVAGAMVVASLLGSEFLPQLDEGSIWVRAILPPGISLQKSADIANEVRRTINESAEVKLVMSQTGRNDSGTDPYGPNRNELLVDLKPYDTWAKGKTKAQLVDELSKKLSARIPGATFSFAQPILDNATEAATGSSADLAVIISGSDLKTLRELGDKTLDVLKKVPGAADTAIEQEADQAQLSIVINRQAVARYGINVSSVEQIIQMAIGGQATGKVFEGERNFDISIRFAQEARADADAIGKILVPTREGGRVPLDQLADIKVINGSSIIARRENQRQITVRTNIRGRDQGSFVADAQKAFAAGVTLPKGYDVDWGGQFENLARAKQRLTLILPITLAIIFGLLFMTFGSARYASLVLASVPFSLVGGVVALYLRGINLSVSAAVGFISLFGVAVMSGVLVVAEINRLRKDEERPFREAIIEGSLTQMRPVLMMILVALLGMVPAARATGIGSDVQRPLATVVVGGLLSTLFLTLLALPSLYFLVADKVWRRQTKTPGEFNPETPEAVSLFVEDTPHPDGATQSNPGDNGHETTPLLTTETTPLETPSVDETETKAEEKHS
jgi:cobalt-zinc-cadmium resistance protein CzcA